MALGRPQLVVWTRILVERKWETTPEDPPRDQTTGLQIAKKRGNSTPETCRTHRSKGDVLLEEVHFLRQMLADSNEEKRIQAAWSNKQAARYRQWRERGQHTWQQPSTHTQFMLSQGTCLLVGFKA